MSFQNQFCCLEKREEEEQLDSREKSEIMIFGDKQTGIYSQSD